MSTEYTPVSTDLTTVTLPDDGDARNAASVNVPFRQLANAVKRALSGIPTFHEEYVGGGGALLTVNNASPGPTVSSSGYVDVPNCIAGDRLLILQAIQWRLNASTTEFFLYVHCTDQYGGASPVAAALADSAHVIDDTTSPIVVNKDIPTMLHGYHVVTAAGTCRVSLSATDGNPSSEEWKLMSMHTTVIRFPTA